MSFDAIKDCEYFKDAELARYTTIRLKKIGDICIVKSLDALIELKRVANKEHKKIHLIGWGANQIIKDTKDKIFVKLDLPFNRDYLKEARDEYDLPASVSLNILQSHAQKFGLKGWEVFTGVPASLGGALVMNAGTSLGEISDVVKSVTVLRENNQIEELENKDLFVYRNNKFLKTGDIILSAKLIHHGIEESIKSQIKEYMQFRKNSQPLKSFNCGCVFKNYSPQHRAGQFIDTLGLKNFTFKSLKVSEVHANFVEHAGMATSDECEYFLDKLNSILEQHTGVKFELEVKIY